MRPYYPKPEKPRNVGLTKVETLYAGLLDEGLTAEQISARTGRKVSTIHAAIYEIAQKRRDLENMALRKPAK